MRIRKLRGGLSRWLDRVQAREELNFTDRGSSGQLSHGPAALLRSSGRRRPGKARPLKSLPPRSRTGAGRAVRTCRRSVPVIALDTWAFLKLVINRTGSEQVAQFWTTATSRCPRSCCTPRQGPPPPRSTVKSNTPPPEPSSRPCWPTRPS